jgi:glycosyltransferase involved in cell wall biosynthesis
MPLILSLFHPSRNLGPARTVAKDKDRVARAEIAYLWPYDIGADPSATFFQRPAGLAEDFTVHLLTRAESRIPSVVAGKVRIQRGPAGRGILARLTHLLFCVRWLARNQSRLSAVYTTGGLSIFTGWFARRFLGIRWVTEFWDHPFLERNYARQNGDRGASFFYLLRSLVANRMARQADVVVCTGNVGMVRALRPAAQKLIVSPNGADRSLFGRQATKSPNSPAEAVYVGWIGRARGAGLMFDAMQLLQSAGAPVRLTLVGPLVSRDREWILRRQRKLEGCLSLTGRLPHADVLWILEKCCLGLYPFPPEEELEFIYPIKVFEYMAMGVVPVCTDLTGVRDIVRNGIDGFLFRTGSAKALARCLLEAVRNGARLGEMSHAARKRAEQFRWDRIHARLNAELASRIGPRNAALSPLAYAALKNRRIAGAAARRPDPVHPLSR